MSFIVEQDYNVLLSVSVNFITCLIMFSFPAISLPPLAIVSFFNYAHLPFVSVLCWLSTTVFITCFDGQLIQYCNPAELVFIPESNTWTHLAWIISRHNHKHVILGMCIIESFLLRAHDLNNPSLASSSCWPLCVCPCTDDLCICNLLLWLLSRVCCLILCNLN